MAKLIEAVTAAEMISRRLNIPLYELVDIFAEIPAVEATDDDIRDN